MNMKKITHLLKTAAAYFSTSAGTVSLIIGLVALAVVVPPFVSIPLIGGIGLACAAVGAYRAWSHMDDVDTKAQRLEEEKEEVLSIGRNLDKRMAEIAEAEHKIEVKLDQHVEADQKHEHEPSHMEPPVMHEDDTEDSYTETVVMPAKVSSHSPHYPNVTIRIRNMPTFFTVDHHPGAHPADWREASQPENREQASHKKMACS